MDTGTDILIEFNPLRCFNPRATLFRMTSSLVKQNGPIQHQSENTDLLDTAVNRSRSKAKPCMFIVLYQMVALISQSMRQSVRTCAELTVPTRHIVSFISFAPNDTALMELIF